MSGDRRNSFSSKKQKPKPTLKSHIEVNLEDDMLILNEFPEDEISIPVFFPEQSFLGRNNSTPQLTQIDQENNQSEIETVYNPKARCWKPTNDISERNKSLPLNYNFRTPPIPNCSILNQNGKHSPLMTSYNS